MRCAEVQDRGTVPEKYKNRGGENMKRREERKQTMVMQDKSLWIRVPSELDHHSADRISAQADELVRTREIQEIVFDFFPGRRSATAQASGC